MATSTIFNFNFNNSEIVDSTGQWYDATTGTPTTEFIEHDGNTALLQRAYVAGTAYTRDINPVFFQSRDPTFTAHTYTIELQLYPLRDPGGANFGPESGPVLDFNPDADAEEGWVRLNTGQHGSYSNTFYWREYNLGPDGDGIPFLTVTAADGTYNRWYSIRIERVDDGTNTGATIKIYVDGTLVVNETLTYPQDARRGRISDSIRYTYRRSSIDPQGAGAAIDNFKLTAGIAPSSVVDVSLANLQRNNANLLSFIKGKVPAVNDGTLTIQKNGTTVDTFTANSSTDKTVNITVPTKTSDLTNDSNFVPSTDLATVATSGNYNDLSNKPTIPTVNNATLTIQKNGTNVTTFSANASTNATANITVPTKTSDLTNDSGFITSDNTKIPLAGSNAISGDLTPATTGAYDLGGPQYRWNHAYIESSIINGAMVITDYKLARANDTGEFLLCGGTGWDDGGFISLCGANHTDRANNVTVGVGPKRMNLYPDGTWTWDGTAVQLISDQRLKQQITEIDDKLLDAWEDVELSQFKYNDAVEQKGKDKARLHTGYVVQQIDSACKSHGVDISAYGLYCHEEYPQEVEEVEVEQADGTKVKERKVIREANEHYSLRYTEVYAVECMYLRRCIARLTARIEELEKGKEQEASK